MESNMQIKIKAKVYDKIKILSDSQSLNRFKDIENLISNCDFMIEVAKVIEANEPYVKVVEKTEETAKTVKEGL